MIRALIFTATAALATAPLAVAQPTTQNACTPNIDGATTLPADSFTPTVCQGGQWQTVDLPAPASDRWVSFGNALTLHGQAMQNPGMLAGSWTGTPIAAGGQCTSVQQTVITPGTLSSPLTAQGQPDAPLTFQVAPTAFTVNLTGNCLWVRHA